jgi:hypothetical protein
MEQFHIYHSNGINKFKEVENQTRHYAGCVEAGSIEEAYMLSQNQDKVWNTLNPCRSTSVGDILQSDEGFYMVTGMGFRLLDAMSKNESELNSLENQSNEC